MADPQGAALQAEADNYIDDHDSVLGDGESRVSSTTSIGSSVLRYREENGRRYHAYKDGKYILPNDEGENDRLDLQHHLYSLTYGGKLFQCQFDKQIHRVLDVGTGTGIWAIDYADEHPESEVLGVDLSPIQPSFVPPNVTFEVDDIEEPWIFSRKFDFIHSRMMTASIEDWPKFFDQAFKYTKPGGYIELSDCVFPIRCDDDSMSPDSSISKWSGLSLSGTRKIGRPLDCAENHKDGLTRAGYVDIVENIYKWPMNRWPKDRKFKELGMWTCENLTSELSGISMALFTRVLGMTREETEVFLVDVRKDMKDTKIHAYLPIYTYYARKPL